MKPSILCYFAASVLAVSFPFTVAAEDSADSGQQLDVLNMETVPDGNYAATFEFEGEPVRAEIRVKDGVVKCVKSEKAPGDRELQGAFGRFALLANGVFIIQLVGERFAATQFWAFKPDGSADIKEIPDRGEVQRAIPIESNG